MNLNQLTNLLTTFHKFGKYPQAGQWPVNLALPSDVSENIKKIRQWTDKTGDEYETSIYWVDGDIVCTPPFRGDSQQVRVNHRIQLRYTPTGGGYFEKKILLNDKTLKSSSTKTVPKQPEIIFLFNFHTHPEYRPQQGQPANSALYSFFSVIDLNTFLSQRSMMMGLVTDKVWLACKTDKVISRIGEVGEQMLYSITEEAIFGAGDIDLKIKDEMKRWGLVFYRGEAGRILIKV